MNKTVPVVDGDPTIRWLVAATLQHRRYATRSITDGMDFLDNFHPWIGGVILGIVMPRLSGIDAMRIMRRRRIALPVITMSGALGHQDARC